MASRYSCYSTPLTAGAPAAAYVTELTRLLDFLLLLHLTPEPNTVGRSTLCFDFTVLTLCTLFVWACVRDRVCRICSSVSATGHGHIGSRPQTKLSLTQRDEQSCPLAVSDICNGSWMGGKQPLHQLARTSVPQPNLARRLVRCCCDESSGQGVGTATRSNGEEFCAREYHLRGTGGAGRQGEGEW